MARMYHNPTALGPHLDPEAKQSQTAAPMSEASSESPPQIREFADQAVEYVRRSVGLTVEYDSDTLPLVDHYLREVPDDNEAAQALIASATGAYFGEVVRHRLGGSWQLNSGDPEDWRFILPGGMCISPVGIAMAAMRRDDSYDPGLDAPPKMMTHIEGALGRMGQTTEEDYFSLCGRLDTIEHIQTVLLAIAKSEADKQKN